MSFATVEGRRSVVTVDWPCSLVFAYFGGASFVHCHFGEVSCAFLSYFFLLSCIYVLQFQTISLMQMGPK